MTNMTLNLSIMSSIDNLGLQLGLSLGHIEGTEISLPWPIIKVENRSSQLFHFIYVLN